MKYKKIISFIHFNANSKTLIGGLAVPILLKASVCAQIYSRDCKFNTLRGVVVGCFEASVSCGAVTLMWLSRTLLKVN